MPVSVLYITVSRSNGGSQAVLTLFLCLVWSAKQSREYLRNDKYYYVLFAVIARSTLYVAMLATLLRFAPSVFVSLRGFGMLVLCDAVTAFVVSFAFSFLAQKPRVGMLNSYAYPQHNHY